MNEPPKHADVAVIFTTLLALSGLNAAGLAKKLDITPQAVSNYMVGRNEPGRKMIAAIIKAFPHVNAGWLATGLGEPFPNGLHGTLPPTGDTSPDTKPPGPQGGGAPGGLHKIPRTAEEEIEYLRHELQKERQAHERTKERHDADRERGHERETLLIKQLGSRPFKPASADAAEPTQPVNMAVSFVNPDQQAAREFQRRRAPMPAAPMFWQRPVVQGFQQQG